MTKEYLKVGMVLEIKREEETYLAMVCENSRHELCVSSEAHWFPLYCFDDNLTYSGNVVTKVYGLSYSNHKAYKVSTEYRNCLWEREEVSYFNGKVVCIESNNDFLTKGKIYEFKDGKSVDDVGDALPFAPTPINSVDELNRRMMSHFIEVVE